MNDQVINLIGNTPMIRLKALEKKEGVALYAKLEFMNPGGSVKDRVGKYMISEAEREGRLQAGSTIIEATAGNTGIGIALAAVEKPYKVIFTVPEKFSVEKVTLMKALGAEIVITPTQEGMVGAVKKAEELLKEHPHAISLRQFENLDNPKVHYLETGPEIYEDMNGDIDYFLAGAGSGGTVSGVSKYLKEKRANIKTYAVEPEGSTMGGGPSGHYDVEGIGNHFIPKTLDAANLDGFLSVKDEDSFEAVKRLAKVMGIIVGSSSGAVFAAAEKLQNQIDKGNIVMVFPDRGDRYFSKNLYD